MPSYVRQTAVLCTLLDLKTGSWVQNPGMTPSGVQTLRGFVSRASVMGVVVQKQDLSFHIEDGTGDVAVRSFEAKPVPVRADVGDVVLVVGRPREYNGERYLVLEICKKLDSAWIQYRKKELDLLGNLPGQEAPKTAQLAPEPVVAKTVLDKNPFERIMEQIRKLDAGSGADIEEIVTTVPQGEQLVRTLLEEGEIFEIRPGRLKVLE
jgi:hypothetical protein